jgi:hypothetical protein
MSPVDVNDMLERLFSAFDREAEAHRLVKIETM